MEMSTIVIAVISSGTLNTLLAYLMTQHEKKKEKKEGIQEGVRLVLKDRLRFLCMRYIKQGWIYQDELEDLIAMHKCYHDELNGNGFLDNLMEKVNKLDIRGNGVK